MILVAGLYRSGTNDDPALIAKNVEAMTAASLALFRAGHLPVMGEWFALPLIEHAGSTGIGDVVFNDIFHPISRRLVAKCEPACASAARRLVPTRWWRSHAARASRCTTRLARCRALDGGAGYSTKVAHACGATMFRMIDWSSCQAVERDPERVSGAWVFRGSRVPVAALFENLEDGVPIGEFVDLFPGVSLAQARAVLEHAARSAFAAV